VGEPKPADSILPDKTGQRESFSLFEKYNSPMNFHIKFKINLFESLVGHIWVFLGAIGYLPYTLHPPPFLHFPGPVVTIATKLMLKEAPKSFSYNASL